MSVKASDSAPWSGRPTSDFCLSARECANLPHTALSRLEARLQLEAALEARNPRLLHKKPTAGGAPIDLYALHQVVLRLGGYRKVRAQRVRARQKDGVFSGKKGLTRAPAARHDAAPRRAAARARAAPRTPTAPSSFHFIRSNPRRFGTRPWRREAWWTASSPGWSAMRCVNGGLRVAALARRGAAEAGGPPNSHELGVGASRRRLMRGGGGDHLPTPRGLARARRASPPLLRRRRPRARRSAAAAPAARSTAKRRCG
jgi:hypothetical protein